MTTKQRIKARQERNRELAQIDTANRCQACKRALRGVVTVTDWGSGKRFCSPDCLAEFQAGR